MYKLKITNTFQDSYNQQRPDGFVSEFDVYGADYDEHTDAVFETADEASEAAEKLTFIDNPQLEVVAA